MNKPKWEQDLVKQKYQVKTDLLAQISTQNQRKDRLAAIQKGSMNNLNISDTNTALHNDFKMKISPDYAKKKAAFDSFGQTSRLKKGLADLQGKQRVKQDMNQYRADLKYYNENYTEQKS